jgi:hypothetical protein
MGKCGDGNRLTQAKRDINEIKKHFSDVVVFIDLGDFNETVSDFTSVP